MGVALLLGHARRRVDPDPGETADLLDRALVELKASLAELRELARGIHPAVLTERGLEPALDALAARAPVPVTLETDGKQRLPAPVEVAAYFVVAEALANVAKYAQATAATVAVRRSNGTVSVDITDDGDRRRRRGARLGPARPRRPRRRARRHALAGEPAGPRNAPARRDPGGRRRGARHSLRSLSAAARLAVSPANSGCSRRTR